MTSFKIKKGMKEGEHYLICGICGKPVRSLGGHIARAHSLSIKEYKDMFKLPYSKGLVCNELHSNLHDSAINRIKRDGLTGKLYNKGRKQSYTKRKCSEYHKEVNINRLKKYQQNHIITIEERQAISKRMKEYIKQPNSSHFSKTETCKKILNNNAQLSKHKALSKYNKIIEEYKSSNYKNMKVFCNENNINYKSLMSKRSQLRKRGEIND